MYAPQAEAKKVIHKPSVGPEGVESPDIHSPRRLVAHRPCFRAVGDLHGELACGPGHRFCPWALESCAMAGKNPLALVALAQKATRFLRAQPL